MLATSLTTSVNLNTRSVTQRVGFGVFTIGPITFLARNDIGSDALKAIMFGNIVFHGLGLFFDIYRHRKGVMKLSGLIPHTLLIPGFVYYLAELGQ